ncbi:GTPase required for pre-60S ribosomal subunit nuclear export and maturation, partial [Teratosphaeriaceae sp. CCFEE 6253]
EAIRFLEALAKKGGRLLRGGEADMDGVAKMVLNDFLRGKIPWFEAPPASTEENRAGEGKVGEKRKRGPDGEEGVREMGRDEKLGITRKKRKRDAGDEGQSQVVEVEVEELSVIAEVEGLGKVNEVANGLREGADGVEEEDGDDEDHESGAEGDFEGFEEDGESEEHAVGGVEVVPGETDDESE